MLDQSDLLRLVNQPLTESTMGEIRMAMTELAAADIGNLLSSTPAAERQQLWDLFDDDLQAEVISHIEPELVPDLFASRSAEEIAQVIEKVSGDDDVTDIIQQLPDALGEEILEALDIQNRERVENLLIYPADTAGGLMDTDIISVRSDITIDVVLRYLRRHSNLPNSTDQVFVVDKMGFYLGTLPLSTILVSDPSTPISDCIETKLEL